MRHSGHIRQRSPGTFEIRYNLGNDPLTGKRKVATSTFKGTYDEAKGELYRLLKAARENGCVEPTKVKIKEFLEQWIETIRSQVSLKTHERYTEIVSYFLVPTFGNCQLTKLTPALIQTAYNKWEASGRRDGREGGLAPRTRLHIHRIFSSALKHAAELQLIVRNPAANVKPPRVKKTAVNVLTVEQSAVLLNAVRGTKLHWPVLLALTTGMRRGEILALRWRNVDFERKTVRVVESLEQTKKGLRFKAPKTEKTRAVILPDYTVNELCEWREKQADQLAEVDVKQTDDSLVCGRWDGEPVHPRTITQKFVAAIKRLPDLPKIRFHDLRHSHATQLLAAGIHPKIAQERLGHSNISTTLDLYSHVSNTMQDEAAEKLDSALKLAMKVKLPKGPQLG